MQPPAARPRLEAAPMRDLTSRGAGAGFGAAMGMDPFAISAAMDFGGLSAVGPQAYGTAFVPALAPALAPVMPIAMEAALHARLRSLGVIVESTAGHSRNASALLALGVDRHQLAGALAQLMGRLDRLGEAMFDPQGIQAHSEHFQPLVQTFLGPATRPVVMLQPLADGMVTIWDPCSVHPLDPSRTPDNALVIVEWQGRFEQLRLQDPGQRWSHVLPALMPPGAQVHLIAFDEVQQELQMLSLDRGPTLQARVNDMPVQDPAVLDDVFAQVEALWTRLTVTQAVLHQQADADDPALQHLHLSLPQDHLGPAGNVTLGVRDDWIETFTLHRADRGDVVIHHMSRPPQPQPVPPEPVPVHAPEWMTGPGRQPATQAPTTAVPHRGASESLPSTPTPTPRSLSSFPSPWASPWQSSLPSQSTSRSPSQSPSRSPPQSPPLPSAFVRPALAPPLPTNEDVQRFRTRKEVCKEDQHHFDRYALKAVRMGYGADPARISHVLRHLRDLSDKKDPRAKSFEDFMKLDVDAGLAYLKATGLPPTSHLMATAKRLLTGYSQLAPFPSIAITMKNQEKVAPAYREVFLDLVREGVTWGAVDSHASNQLIDGLNSLAFHKIPWQTFAGWSYARREIYLHREVSAGRMSLGSVAILHNATGQPKGRLTKKQRRLLQGIGLKSRRMLVEAEDFRVFDAAVLIEHDGDFGRALVGLVHFMLFLRNKKSSSFKAECVKGPDRIKALIAEATWANVNGLDSAAVQSAIVLFASRIAEKIPVRAALQHRSPGDSDAPQP
jgi:hypothetical protein